MHYLELNKCFIELMLYVAVKLDTSKNIKKYPFMEILLP